jgi:hypothetical protein
VKALGRVAYRHLRATGIEGGDNFEGEDKHFSNLTSYGLRLELWSHSDSALSLPSIQNFKFGMTDGRSSTFAGTRPVVSRCVATSPEIGSERYSTGLTLIRLIDRQPTAQLRERVAEGINDLGVWWSQHASLDIDRLRACHFTTHAHLRQSRNVSEPCTTYQGSENVARSAIGDRRVLRLSNLADGDDFLTRARSLSLMQASRS